MNLANQRSTQLLENDPRKAVRNARTYIHSLRILARYWTDFPDTIRFGVLDTFSHHLNSVDPPRDLRRTSHQSRACDGAYHSIVGLSFIYKFLAPDLHPDVDERKLANLFPGLLKWSVFFYTEQAERTTISTQSRWENVRFIAKAWHDLTHCEAVVETIVITDGAVELAAKLWLLEPTFPEVSSPEAHPWASALIARLLQQEDADTVSRLVKGVGDDTSRTGAEVLAELTMSRLKTWTHSLRGTNKMAAIYYLDMIILMSRGKDSPLRNLFLNKHKVIPYCTNLALRAAQLLDKNQCTESLLEGNELLTILVSSFSYLCNYLNSTDGFTWVLQAVNACILKAFVLASQHFHLIDDLEKRTAVTNTVLNVIPLYTAYRSVTSAVSSSLKELYGQGYHRIVENSIVKDDWAIFIELVARRRETVELAKDLKGKIGICNNVDCHKTGNMSMFRQCSGCNKATYCSKECQRAAWKYNHKSVCKTMQEDYLDGKKHEFHRVDDHFVHFLPSHDVKSNLAELRRQASNPAFEAVKEGGFVVYIDYTTLPESYEVKPLLWHDGIRPSEFENLGFVPKRSEEQIDEFEEEVRQNKDKLTLIQSAVRNGEVVRVISSVIAVPVFNGLDGAYEGSRTLDADHDADDEEYGIEEID